MKSILGFGLLGAVVGYLDCLPLTAIVFFGLGIITGMLIMRDKQKPSR